MIRIKVKIDNEEDLEGLIGFLKQKEIKYQIDAEDETESILKEDAVAYQKTDLVEDHEDFIYTDEIKRELDEDEKAYQKGELIPISSEESKRRIADLLNKLKA